MSTEIVKRARDPIALGTVLAQSGYFADAKSAAQAAVKVMAGDEVGLGPIASMTGIHIVEGKVTLGANIIAALVRRHPDYDYEVTEHTAQVCTIVFTYRGKPAGVSTFSIDDAKKAGLLKPNPKSAWNAHPRNMLFARAMSNGAKWYAPDVSAGTPIYTPDELGAEVDGETLEHVPSPVPAPVTAPQAPGFITPDQRRAISAASAKAGLDVDASIQLLVETAGVDNTAAIPVEKYADVLAAFEAVEVTAPLATEDADTAEQTAALDEAWADAATTEDAAWEEA